MSSNISTRRLAARKSGDDEYVRRREALVAAAATVFKEKGYAAANVEDIATAAGMDRASIYYYFRGKQELFRDMVRGAVTGNVQMAEQIASGAGTPPDKLRALIGGLFASYERHYPYLFIYVQEDMARMLADTSAWSTEIKSLSRRFDRAITAIIRAGLDDGSFTSRGDARLVAAGVIGMCNWSHRWYEPGRGPDRALICETFADMVLGGLVAGHRPHASPS